MNCGQFTDRWSQYVGGAIEPTDESAMLEHSRDCTDCGKRWREHQELVTTLDSILGENRPPDDLTRSILEKLPIRSVPVVPTATAETVSPSAPASHPIMVALVGGLILGFGMGVISQGNAAQQLLQQATYAEFARGSTSARFAGLALNSGGTAVATILGILLLVWLTRTRLWDVLFPYHTPTAVSAARWIAIFAISFGLVRVLCTIMVPLVAWYGPRSGLIPLDAPMWLAGEALFEFLWALTFWTALAVLALGILNELLIRYARPLE